MTVTAEGVETEETGADEVETETKGKRGRTRDFTKSNEHYDSLAAFINSNSDWQNASLGTVTPLQVKAVLALKTDFANTPEVIAARAERKAALAAENAEYEGLSPDQIKAKKAAVRAQKQYDKLNAKAQEALANAEKLKAAASGSAEDLQAVVESEQSEGEDEPKKRRGLRR